MSKCAAEVLQYHCNSSVNVLSLSAHSKWNYAEIYWHLSLLKVTAQKHQNSIFFKNRKLLP